MILYNVPIDYNLTNVNRLCRYCVLASFFEQRPYTNLVNSIATKLF